MCWWSPQSDHTREVNIHLYADFETYIGDEGAATYAFVGLQEVEFVIIDVKSLLCTILSRELLRPRSSLPHGIAKFSLYGRTCTLRYVEVTERGT